MGLALFRKCCFLVCIVVIAGCEVTDVPEGGPVNVSFRVEKNNYKIGSSVKTILKNESELQISFNPCSSKLVHKKDETWKETESSLFCTSKLINLNSGELVSYSIELNDNMKLREGRYKVKANIEVEEQKTLTTQSFEVYAN